MKSEGDRWAGTARAMVSEAGDSLGEAPGEASSWGALLSLAGSHWEGSRWQMVESDLHISKFTLYEDKI